MTPRGGRLARCDPCQAAKLTSKELKVGFGEGTQSAAVSFDATWTFFINSTDQTSGGSRPWFGRVPMLRLSWSWPTT
jgi:hypothetical protein